MDRRRGRASERLLFSFDAFASEGWGLTTPSPCLPWCANYYNITDTATIGGGNNTYVRLTGCTTYRIYMINWSILSKTVRFIALKEF